MRNRDILPIMAIGSALLLIAPVYLMPPQAYAACATYSSTSNTITITCDTTWSEAISGLAASAVVDQGNGEYIVGNIVVRDGVRLTIDSGTWLKITGANGITVYGYLDADSVKITSWDTAANSVIDNQGSEPRAYMRYRAGDGGIIQNSELAYLGYLCSGSCTYKRGISLETYGGAGTQGVDMVGNTFHHNYYAYYTNSAYDLVVDGNEFYSNTQYDIDPHTATHDMQITNNHIHDSGRYGIICSLDCYNILIEGNKVHDMTNVGIFFSRNMHDSVARNNEIWNVLTGILFSESPDNEAYGNSIHDVRRGIYFLNPPTPAGVTQNNHVHDNTIYNAQYAIMSIRSPLNTLENNEIGDGISSYEYYASDDSKLVINNQDFTNDRMRGQSGSNTIEIGSSGYISVNGGEAIDTDTTPYSIALTSATIVVNAASPPSNDTEPAPQPTPDTTAPSVRITDPSNNANALLGTLTVSGTSLDNEDGSGVKTVQVRVHKWVNGQLGDLYRAYQTAAPAAEGDWSTWSLGIDFTETGSYRIQARATDNSGNQAWNSIIVTISETEPEPQVPDTTIPDVRITSPSTGSTVPAGTVDVQGTAADNDGGSGIKTVQVRVHRWVDGSLGDLYLGYQTVMPASEGDWSTWAKTLSIPDTGTFRIQARATDNAGNQDWHSIIVSVG